MEVGYIFSAQSKGRLLQLQIQAIQVTECGYKNMKLIVHVKKSQGWKCLGARNVSGLDMFQGWTCLWCLKLHLKKAEKERLRRNKDITGPDFSKHFWAGLVSGPDLSWGRTSLRILLFSGPDLPKNFRPEVSKRFRAESDSRPEVSCLIFSLSHCPFVSLSRDIDGTSVPLSRKVALSRPVGNASICWYADAP